MLDSQQVEMVVGDGREGYPDEGPYDAIHVGASAPHLPQALGKTINMARYRQSVLWISSGGQCCGFALVSMLKNFVLIFLVKNFCKLPP